MHSSDEDIIKLKEQYRRANVPESKIARLVGLKPAKKHKSWKKLQRLIKKDEAERQKKRKQQELIEAKRKQQEEKRSSYAKKKQRKFEKSFFQGGLCAPK